MVLTETMLEEMRKTILPEIMAASEDALRSYSAAESPEGENFADNWVLGCTCWRILFNRLNTRLDGHSFFSKKVTRNVMEISCPNAETPFVFYVYRVDDEQRIPRGAKSIKVYLQQQLWLSDEIRANKLEQSSGINILGYDISIESGLGNITLDRLCAVDKNKFEPVRLHDFDSLAPAVTTPSTEPEQVEKPKVSGSPEEIVKPSVNKDKDVDQDDEIG